jgi:hypothetical protein
MECVSKRSRGAVFSRAGSACCDWYVPPSSARPQGAKEGAERLLLWRLWVPVELPPGSHSRPGT